jgi:8-oxo-dGTP pyrophosphatase MutT (NUDIX family)
MDLKWKIREKGLHKIEVHVAGICLDGDASGDLRILIGKRNPRRELFPNKWECGGGQVHDNETFEEAIRFHMKEELNVDVDVICPILTYRIETSRGVIPGLRLICRIKDTVQEPRPNPEEFTDCRWIDEDEIDDYDFIPGLKAHLRSAIELYRRLVN